jgi:hypothetical protein
VVYFNIQAESVLARAFRDEAGGYQLVVLVEFKRIGELPAGKF